MESFARYLTDRQRDILCNVRLAHEHSCADCRPPAGTFCAKYRPPMKDGRPDPETICPDWSRR